MDYEVTAADLHAVPASYATEPRYLGYREPDRSQAYASFYTPQMAHLPAHIGDALHGGMAPTEYYVDLNDLADQLQRPGYSALENGWTGGDGRIYVAVRTDMPGVAAEMWDWWFGWHLAETARYKLWYPDAHQFTAVGDDRSAVRTLTDRQRYLDNVSYVDEYIGGHLMRLAIRFVDPSKLGFDDRPGFTHICARVGFSDRPLAFGWLVHQVRPTEEGCEMRSRFVLNAPAILDLPSDSQGTRAGNRLLGTLNRAGIRNLSPRITASAMPPTTGSDMIFHCAKEMNHLAGFLPQLHAAFAGTP